MSNIHKHELPKFTIIKAKLLSDHESKSAEKFTREKLGLKEIDMEKPYGNLLQ